jgi:acyl-CoA synthetase (AMP-forming)/AMP-acid ligase II
MQLPPELPRIADYARYYAERTPDAEAMVLGDQRISYAELDRRVDALARALLAAGVAVGDRVATLQSPCPDFFVTFLAATSIGAIWVGLNPKYRLGELLYVVEDCRPRLLLTRLVVGSRRYDEEVVAIRNAATLETVVGFDGCDPAQGVMAYDDFVATGAAITNAELAARREQVGGRQACLLVYTSGTTGKPKGAVLQQRGIIAFSIEQNRIWPVEPLRELNYFPINHVGCTVDLATPCLVAGGTTVFMEQFDAAESMDIIEAEKITFWGSPPSVFMMQLAELDKRPRDLSAVRLICWEGAAISSEALDRLMAICPLMCTNYGQTESTGAMTGTAPTNDRDRLLNSVGTEFPGVEIRLVDLDGNEVPDGTPGEVLARSPYSFIEYWNRPEASVEAYTADGFLRTGDLAVRRPDGTYRIAGRIREMYKSGGYNVYPREVEILFEDHPAVSEAVVVAIPDAKWQEVGVLYVTLQGEATAAELMAYARERLANYKLPKRIHIEAEMPLLPIGKIDRTALKRRAAAE